MAHARCSSPKSPARAASGATNILGARAAIVKSDGSTIWRRARADGSYGSANDPRVLAGLGQSATPPTVRVMWPDGRTEEWSEVAVDRYTTLRQGAGRAKDSVR